jgi:hypothetical protein
MEFFQANLKHLNNLQNFVVHFMVLTNFPKPFSTSKLKFAYCKKKMNTNSQQTKISHITH